MKEKGLVTSLPFPGAMFGWKGKCNRCGNLIFPKYSAVKAGQGVCKYCAGRALSFRDAMTLLQKANLKPIEKFSKASIKLRCQCLRCSREVDARLLGIAQGEGGCAYCAGRKVDAEEALITMQDAGFEPLVPFPGSKVRWKCKCNTCGQISTPTYGSVKSRNSGCIYCNRDNGAFDGSQSGVLYLISHRQYNSLKIGITSRERKSDRLKTHKSAGWEVYKAIEFQDGSEAFRIEQAIIEWSREELNLGPFLSSREMPQGGYSETFDASEIDLNTLWNKVQQLCKFNFDEVTQIWV